MGRRIDADVASGIEFLARRGYNAGAIRHHLQKESERGTGDAPPDIRTIRSIAKRVKRPVTEAVWRITSSTPEDARIVLTFLADCSLTKHPIPFGALTMVKAEWVIRITKLAPELNAEAVDYLSDEYLSRGARGITDTRDLDGYLAFRPWADPDGDDNRQYDSAVERGVIPVFIPRRYLSLLSRTHWRKALRNGNEKEETDGILRRGQGDNG